MSISSEIRRQVESDTKRDQRAIPQQFTLQFVLHVLRNPWGHSDEIIREVRLEAANRLEQNDK